MRKKKPKAGSTLRLVRLPEPSEELLPWVGGIKRKAKIWDTPYPYPNNGLISPEGWFFECNPGGHSYWSKENLGVIDRFLVDDCGWVVAWDFVSAFSKAKTPDFRFRWDTSRKLTVEQKATMVRCCEAWGLTTAQALKGFISAFERED